ncbi:MAG: hypothetical protein ACLFV3_08665 [Phycisphaeraceae bacterium]
MRTLAAAAAATLLLTSAARAAFISEVFQAGDHNPAAIEIDGLAGLDSVQLLVLTASDRPGRRPSVLRSIALPTDHPVALVSEAPWPDRLWTQAGQLGPEEDEPQPLVLPRGLALADQPRTLLLLAGGEPIREGSYFSLPPAPASHTTPDVPTRLDWLTFSPDGSGKPLADEPVRTLPGSTVLSRAVLPDGQPSGEILVGEPDPHGFLEREPVSYRVSPGVRNELPSPSHHPEPASWLLFAPLLAATWAARRPT